VADALVVARIGLRADDRAAARADAGHADVGRRAGAAVAARRAVGLDRVGAARGRIAGPRVVALIRRGARRGRARDADAGLAGVAEGAGVEVGAGRSVDLGRVGADARRRVADADVVALVRRGAHD